MNATPPKPVGIGTIRLSDDEIIKRLSVIDSGISQREAAKRLGIHPRTIHRDAANWRKRAAERNLLAQVGGASPLPTGFVIKEHAATYKGGLLTQERITAGPEAGPAFELLPGHYYKGISAFVDADGRIKGQWLKTDTERMAAHEAGDIVGRAMEKYQPLTPSIIRLTAGEVIYSGSVNKLNELHDGSIVAWSGRVSEGLRAIAWLQAKGKEKEKLEEKIDWNHINIIQLMPDGTLVERIRDSMPMIVPGSYWAWGSGREFAIGALAAGCSAEEAVRIACLHDVNSAEPIHTKSLK